MEEKLEMKIEKVESEKEKIEDKYNEKMTKCCVAKTRIAYCMLRVAILMDISIPIKGERERERKEHV
jgi:hypothetical protein